MTFISPTCVEVDSEKPMFSWNGCLALILALSFLRLAVGEDRPKTAAKVGGSNSEGLIASVNTVLVHYAEPQSIPGISSSPLVVHPILCAPDGAAILGQLLPPDFLDIEVDSIAPDNVRNAIAIVKSQIPGFSHIRLLSYFATDSKIAILGEGTLSNLKATIEGPKNYIFLFNRKGVYESSILLDFPVSITRFAMLSSGNFVIAGIDRGNLLPKLALLKDDGSISRYLDMDLNTLAEVNKAYSGEFGDRAGTPDRGALGDMLTLQQFVPYRGNLLLVSGRSTMPVLEISDAGVVRSTIIKMPSDMQIESFVPSEQNWIVRLRKRAAKDQDKDEYYLFEVNPETGDFLRRFDSNVPVLAIACASRNSFTSFSMAFKDKVPHLQLLIGSY